MGGFSNREYDALEGVGASTAFNLGGGDWGETSRSPLPCRSAGGGTHQNKERCERESKRR